MKNSKWISFFIVTLFAAFGLSLTIAAQTGSTPKKTRIGKKQKLNLGGNDWDAKPPRKTNLRRKANPPTNPSNPQLGGNDWDKTKKPQLGGNDWEKTQRKRQPIKRKTKRNQ